jgi:hypothetical protein
MFSARPHTRAQLLARALGAAAFLGVMWVTACMGDRVAAPANVGDVFLEDDTAFTSSLGKPVPIEFETYESSRQVVHPSAVAFPSAWNGQRFWLALTPYPNSDSHVENPSIFSSADGNSFAVPAGVTNPVAKTSRGYLSDPDLVFDPASNQLRMYYREVVESHRHGKRPHHRADVVYVTQSSDGVQWSAPRAVAAEIGHYVVSPAVARRADGDWKMWAVDAGQRGCTSRETRIVLRHSTDGIGWSAPTAVSFLQPGFLPWHLDVQYVPQLNAYWALVAAYRRGSACTTSSLFLATSSDGVDWKTYPSPVLERGALPQFSANVYRSTFAFEPDGNSLTLWLTGATTVQRGERRKAPVLRWSAAVWHTQRLALLEHVRLERQASAMADSEPSFLRRLAVENALP